MGYGEVNFVSQVCYYFHYMLPWSEECPQNWMVVRMRSVKSYFANHRPVASKVGTVVVLELVILRA